VRRGETVILSQWVIHRDPALWPDPLRFDPERFHEAEEAPRHRFAYFPFGAGPRVCIGEGFAWTEVLLVLATLAQRFRFRLAAGQLVEPLPRVTLRLRHGLRMIVEERTSLRVGGARQAPQVTIGPGSITPSPGSTDSDSAATGTSSPGRAATGADSAATTGSTSSTPTCSQ
jgi:Cytochrome P450